MYFKWIIHAVTSNPGHSTYLYRERRPQIIRRLLQKLQNDLHMPFLLRRSRNPPQHALQVLTKCSPRLTLPVEINITSKSEYIPKFILTYVIFLPLFNKSNTCFLNSIDRDSFTTFFVPRDALWPCDSILSYLSWRACAVPRTHMLFCMCNTAKRCS